MARMRDYYRDTIVPELTESLGISNRMALPRLEKIVINMGVGLARENRKLLDTASADLGILSGQKPVLTRARKSVANFKLREGMAIGCKVTLRSTRMYEFLDRLICLAIPRIRDFRGLSRKSFDGHGNYGMGLNEQLAFPEISVDKMENVQGMDICIVTTATTDEQALDLLTRFGMPFREN